MKFHPLADLFPLITGTEFQDLVADIKANGLREPIWIFEDQILDGRNRWLACNELGFDAATCQYDGVDPLGFVLSLNLHRRHLNAGQLAMLALRIEALEASAAKERMFAGVKIDPEATLPQGTRNDQSRDKAAKATGSSGRNVQKAKKVKGKRPDLAEKVEAGTLSLNAAERQTVEDEAKANLHRPVVIELSAGLHHGDFRELAAQIADNSVELVFTDPPYDGDSVTLYEDAARVAARILKPGGSFIAYSGQSHLPAVLVGCAKHLRYWWTIAGVHSGGNQMLQKLGIRCGWKPLVWFVKGTRGDVQNVLSDVVAGSREKNLHKWQQAEVEAEYYIEQLTSPHGLVVDFFIGSGTTAIAAQRLGRPWIGFETDAAAAESASRRLVQAAA